MTATAPFMITADEVNCLIHSYFQDSGFVHSAFVLRAEGHLEGSQHYGKHIPRGELIELLSKALLYSEAEAHWKGNAMTNNCKASFSILDKHVCSLDPNIPATVTFHPPVIEVTEPTANSTSEKRKASTPPAPEDIPKEKRARTEEMEVDSVASAEQPAPATMTLAVPAHDGSGRVREVERRFRWHKGVRVLSDVGLLRGHNSEVFVCAWNPVRKELLGTGSKDTVINIWQLHDKDPSEEDITPTSDSPLTFAHLNNSDQGDLTSLDWNPDGTLLAAGSYDTYLRVCDASGKLYFAESMQKKGPVFATRFSPTGQYLLTASIDGSVCVWDIPKKALYKQYHTHENCCLDVEWLTDDIFVSCGVDLLIHVMKLGVDNPLETLSGHIDEVNQLKCNPRRTLLASCSDDGTARVWDIEAIKLGKPFNKKVLMLEGHSSTVSSIAWCPWDQHSIDDVLATSSLDGTARLWNTTTGECLRVFQHHKAAVYTLAFSPDGRLFATAGADGYLYVYDVKSKELKWSWHSTTESPAVFEIDWQQFGNVNRIAMALESGLVGIVDITQIPEVYL